MSVDTGLRFIIVLLLCIIVFSLRQTSDKAEIADALMTQARVVGEAAEKTAQQLDELIIYAHQINRCPCSVHLDTLADMLNKQADTLKRIGVDLHKKQGCK